MSSKNQDKLNEWIEDNSIELMEEYLQGDMEFLDFGGWLFERKQEALLVKVLTAYFEDIETADPKFYEWAVKQAEERLSYAE